jgi:hypothetical protein
VNRQLTSRATRTRRLSDPASSRAVLIEAHAFTKGGSTTWGPDNHLEDRPSVAVGCQRLAELLRDPDLWGLSEENCTVVSQPTRDRLLEAVHAAASEATDTLVVYYAGHGLLYPHSEDLHLAVPETTKDKAFTAVKYDDVRTILLSATQVRRKVVILDCCFSGTAMRGTLSADSDAVRLAAIEGSSVLAAAHATKQAVAPVDEPYPAFTGELVSLLAGGDPDGPELLSMADLFERVHQSLIQKGRPRPQQLNRDQGAHICIARNRAWRPPSAEDDLGHPEPTAVPRRRRAVVGLSLAGILAAGLGLWASYRPDDGCGKVSSAVEEVSVRTVHDAACTGDFDAMETAMDRNGFDGTGFSAEQPRNVVASWKKRADRSDLLRNLATVLEREPVASQGGLLFTDGKRVATWARGPGTVPDSHYRWTGYFDCTRPPDSQHPACDVG